MDELSNFKMLPPPGLQHPSELTILKRNNISSFYEKIDQLKQTCFDSISMIKEIEEKIGSVFPSINKPYNLYTRKCNNNCKCYKIFLFIHTIVFKNNKNNDNDKDDDEDDDDDDDDDENDDNDENNENNNNKQLCKYEKLIELNNFNELFNLEEIKTKCNFYHSDFEIRQMIILIVKYWNKNIYKFIKKINCNFTNMYKSNTLANKYNQPCIYGVNCWSCIIHNNCLKCHTNQDLININFKIRTRKLKNIFNLCKHQYCIYHIQGKCKFYHTIESEKILKLICTKVGHIFGTNIDSQSSIYRNILYELKYINNF